MFDASRQAMVMPSTNIVAFTAYGFDSRRLDMEDYVFQTQPT